MPRNWTEKELRDAQELLKVGGELIHTPKASEDPYTGSVGHKQPNKWESAYAAEVLDPLLLTGEIIWYGFEAEKLRLAGKTYYTPDFVVLTKELRKEFVEVKGFVRDDAIAKLKIAAEQFPFRFQMVRKKSVSEGGGWETVRDLFAGLSRCIEAAQQRRKLKVVG
jgi:hypothetical protein